MYNSTCIIGYLTSTWVEHMFWSSWYIVNNGSELLSLIKWGTFLLQSCFSHYFYLECYGVILTKLIMKFLIQIQCQIHLSFLVIRSWGAYFDNWFLCSIHVTFWSSCGYKYTKKAGRKYPDRRADSCKHSSVNRMAAGSRLSWCIMDFFSCLQLFKHTVLT